MKSEPITLNQLYTFLIEYTHRNKISLYECAIDDVLEQMVIRTFSYHKKSFILTSIYLYYKKKIDNEIKKREDRKKIKIIGLLLIVGSLLLACIKLGIIVT